MNFRAKLWKPNREMLSGTEWEDSKRELAPKPACPTGVGPHLLRKVNQRTCTPYACVGTCAEHMCVCKCTRALHCCLSSSTVHSLPQKGRRGRRALGGHGIWKSSGQCQPWGSQSRRPRPCEAESLLLLHQPLPTGEVRTPPPACLALRSG